MLDKGYEVKVHDLDKHQVSKNNLDMNPLFFDLLKPVPEQFFGAFDCVIDSSVTDVFMQLKRNTIPNTGVASNVYKKMLSTLKENGVIVTFSMNNHPWTNIISNFSCKYMVVRPKLRFTTLRGRITTKIGEDILVIVLSKIQFDLSTVDMNTHDATTSDWMNNLPEDWISQRP